jgi:Holliday junction resolvasome RuvABC endonuclease subunit
MIRYVAKQQLRVLGVDPSLSSTGFSYRDNADIYTGVIATKGMSGPARLAYARDQLLEIVCNYRPDLVVYEDYAKGKGGMGRTFDIGELGGAYKLALHDAGIPVMLVSPSMLKKIIVGRGNADQAKSINGKKVKDKSKPEMRSALLRTFGVEFGKDQSDEADACGLMLLGEMRFGSHTVAKTVQSALRLDGLSECVIIHPSHSNSVSQQLKSIAK